MGDNYDALLGDAHIVEGMSRQFDIILANINRNILLADMPRWRPLLSPSGALILSGFYASDVDALTTKAAELGLKVHAHNEDGNWQCLVFYNDENIFISSPQCSELKKNA